MDGNISHQKLIKTVKKLEEENHKLRQNEARLESLLKLSQLTYIKEEEIREFALEIVVSLTESTGGYLHFYNEDNKTIDLVAWSKAVLEECNAEKAQHYPIDRAGLWADSIRLRRPVVHNDFQNEPDKMGYPEGHFKLIRHISVPIFDQGKIVAVAGVGNKTEDYNDSDIRQIMLFMNSMWTILKQKRTEIIIKKQSIEDGLTDLANRRRFNEAIEIEWRRALRNKYFLSIVLFDIDHFKSYNDTYGHQSGDECLIKIGECLKNQIQRAGELAARYGGEEFVVLLPGINIKGALKIADLMRQNIHDMKIPHSSSNVSEYVTISAGVASTVPERENDYSLLIKKADIELYQAKKKGRNQVSGIELQ